MANSATLNLVTVQGEGLRFSVSSGSGHTTTTDSGAGMIAPSPVELLLVALAGCTSMDVISILRKKRQQVTAYAIDIKGERRTEHPKSYTKIEIVHRFGGHDLDHEAIAHAIHLSHTRYCSVQASLDPAIEVSNRFEVVESGGPVPGAGTE
jgi:putative redox protein